MNCCFFSLLSAREFHYSGIALFYCIVLHDAVNRCMYSHLTSISICWLLWRGSRLSPLIVLTSQVWFMPMSRSAWRSRTLLVPGCQATVSMERLLCAVQLMRTRWPSSTTQTQEDSKHVSDGSDVNLITGRSVIEKQLSQSNYRYNMQSKKVINKN